MIFEPRHPDARNAGRNRKRCRMNWRAVVLDRRSPAARWRTRTSALQKFLQSRCGAPACSIERRQDDLPHNEYDESRHPHGNGKSPFRAEWTTPFGSREANIPECVAGLGSLVHCRSVEEPACYSWDELGTGCPSAWSMDRQNRLIGKHYHDDGGNTCSKIPHIVGNGGGSEKIDIVTRGVYVKANRLAIFANVNQRIISTIEARCLLTEVN